MYFTGLGIKIFIDPAIDVVGGLAAELLLDFDVSQSFVVQGNPDSPAGINGFIFKPTIKAANLSTSGRLVGTISDDLDQPIEGVLVSVYASDTLYTSTRPVIFAIKYAGILLKGRIKWLRKKH